MTHSATERTLRTPALARVEGEGAMVLRLRDGGVEEVQLNIYEPPRFFEAFLVGRRYTEPPDITARICGICPVAYQMSACAAIEDACAVEVTGPLRDLRRLIYCGEWIESHALHVYLLHAPDFLGYPSALELAADHRAVVERGLQLKKAGNEVIELIGGRAIHPINVRVGGFYRAPTAAELRPLRERMERARDAALETVRWVAGFDFPDFDQDYEFVAIHGDGEYPMLGDRVASSGGLEFGVRDFEEHVVEEHVPHSTALHARLDGARPYLTGPLARYALNRELLSPAADAAAREAGLGDEVRNPFRSIVVRAVEIVHACEEAIRIIDGYEPPDHPFVDAPPRAATGFGCSEAPRGVLFHRYAIDGDGLIASARIVPPTSQNQGQIEDDLRRFVEPRVELPVEELTAQCEQAVRNHDPCISCATHFLDVTVEQA
ncbi:MAG TPA: Ni/Fe hydrogenase subunit alpha [Actinomycetota bacterium]|nr:Ni/Fe hydrogenase subunit alpha [Actinomycetota bacterium]